MGRASGHGVGSGAVPASATTSSKPFARSPRGTAAPVPLAFPTTMLRQAGRAARLALDGLRPPTCLPHSRGAPRLGDAEPARSPPFGRRHPLGAGGSGA